MNEEDGKVAWDEYRAQLISIIGDVHPQYKIEWENIGRPLQHVWMKVADKVILTHKGKLR